MRVKFLGGVRTVTGSSTLLERGPLKWLVDCGMFQGGRALEQRNRSVEEYHPRNLSFILLTHAHIDHSGLIPKLVKEGFRGKVFCTKATLDLCGIMLRDSAHIQEMEAEWESRKRKRSGGEETSPLYTVKDAEESLSNFQPINYDEIVPIEEGIKIRFQDAGHILGSAIIELWVKEGDQEKKLIFSGDLGGKGQPIIRDPARVSEGDFLWLESTYGNRLHRSREDTVEELLNILRDAFAHQAKVIIPAFAIERTQDIIYTLGELIRKGLIFPVPIYIDSPLAISATEIFRNNSDCFDQEAKKIFSQGEDPLEIPGIIFTRTKEDSQAINEDKRAGIIISASGMCEAGRIKHHLKHHLWREESHIVFIGYQAEGTVGRRIVDGAKKVRLLGEDIAVRANVHTLGGFSAHADQKGLIEWLSNFDNPSLEVFINHGDEKISEGFGQIIRERFNFKTTIPRWMEQRTLFGPEEEMISEEVEELPKEEIIRYLSKKLDRNYKKLRRKLRRIRMKGEGVYDPGLLRRLEEIDGKIEELEDEL